MSTFGLNECLDVLNFETGDLFKDKLTSFRVIILALLINLEFWLVLVDMERKETENVKEFICI